MTRAKQVAHAVTALREPRQTESSLPESAPMTFLIYEDNGGLYHWTIVAADGATLTRSAGFASYDDAEQAAQRVRGAATSARFDRQGAGAPPIDLIVHRDAASDDAER